MEGASAYYCVMTRTYSLNGLVKNQPRGATYGTKTIPRKKYLQSILNRLRDEVGPIVECIEEHNKSHKDKIGFFSMVRIIMPIIEVIATSEGRIPQDLMKDLGMTLPHTEWHGYRDIFLHNDEFVILAVENLGLQTAIFLTSEDEQEISDFLAKDGRNIDPFRLRRLLVDYLEQKIQKTSDDDTVEIISELVYDPASPDPEIQGAIQEIRDFHVNTQRLANSS